MAKPRIFISSTYYDLKHIRNSIESFVDLLGYESVLFESGDIPFSHHDPLDESCYKEIEVCHMLVLIIGGRYGSKVSSEENTLSVDELERHYQHFNSITKKEYETAIHNDLPVYIFVEKGVSAEYQTFKENRENKTIKYAHVDSVNIFRLLDNIFAQRRNNLVRDFENFEDISVWLKDQWAGLFANFLSKKSTESNLKSLSKQLKNLDDVTNALKDYTENIIKTVQPENSEKIINETNEKLRHNKDINIFMENQTIKHLLEKHDADLEELFNSFVTSNSFTNFIRKKNKFFPQGENSPALRNGMRARKRLDELREELGLPEWQTPNK